MPHGDCWGGRHGAIHQQGRAGLAGVVSSGSRRPEREGAHGGALREPPRQFHEVWQTRFDASLVHSRGQALRCMRLLWQWPALLRCARNCSQSTDDRSLRPKDWRLWPHYRRPVGPLLLSPDVLSATISPPPPPQPPPLPHGVTCVAVVALSMANGTYGAKRQRWAWQRPKDGRACLLHTGLWEEGALILRHLRHLRRAFG